MKVGRALLLLVASMALTVLVPPASAAEQIEASGTTATIKVTVTPVRSNGEVAVVDVTALSTFSGTFNGSSMAKDRCVEKLSTGEASCVGQETFTGTVADRAGTVIFHDTFKINFNTGATEGHSSIVGGTANVRGVLTFSGNAFAPLPYQGHVVLV